MPAEPSTHPNTTIRRLRADVAEPEQVDWLRQTAWILWAVIAGTFALLYAGSLEPNEVEARLGLAISSGRGPLGLVFGGWDPAIWPAAVWFGKLWAWADGGRVLLGAIRWPLAVAATILGALLARGLDVAMGPRAGLFAAVAWFGCLGLIDPSGGVGSAVSGLLGHLLGLDPRVLASALAPPGSADLLVGLGTVAALNHMLTRGTGWGAGLWASLAFLAGGWPPLALLALAPIVLARRSTSWNWSFALPPALTVVAWSAWAYHVSPEAWGTALTLPLAQKPAWLLAPGVIGLALPWAPLALVAASKSFRLGWSEDARKLVVGWLQVAGASAVVGTLIPGLAGPARLPILAGLAMAAGAVADRVWDGTLSPSLRRSVLTGGLVVVLGWAALMVPGGTYLALSVAYYRPMGIGLVVLVSVALLVGLLGARLGRGRWVLGAVTLVALSVKLTHAGVYVPEWNYRMGQGPWGRAIGQSVPPRWPIYTLHPWPASLAFATGHPVVPIADERFLNEQKGPRPQFVLLLPEEYKHWQRRAPKLIRVSPRDFLDESGRPWVLARTEGAFAWYKLIKEPPKD